MGEENSGAKAGPTDDLHTATGESDAQTNWSPLNWTVIALFSMLTLTGMWLATGPFGPAVAIPTGERDPGLVTVPLYVYLYAAFGALGYIFTKLMVDLDQYTSWGEREHLVAMAMRVPAAWILATGIFLFLGDLGQTSGTDGARFTAGVAFLVGLYVNVAMKALGSLADRILGRGTRRPE